MPTCLWAILRCATIGFVALMTLPFAHTQDGAPFTAGCTPMFTPLTHPIDSDCGIEGASTADDKKLEAKAKNNFCATGSPARLTFLSFDKLQQLTKSSSFDLGDDRSGARKIHTTSDGKLVGEGDLVTFAGFVIRADTANRSSGETVNCKKGGVARNDIHIHIAPTASKAKANFCKAVIAEMSPHLRPDHWTGGNLMLPDDVPIRLTGHLFYDTSHKSAQCPSAAKDKAKARVSSWEIHPVYQVDVCKFTTLQTCDPRNNSKWQSLDD